MKIKFFILLILICLLVPFFSFSYSRSALPSITVINLIRGKQLGHEKDDLLSSLKAQWQVTKEEKVNATWLWQFGALEDIEMTSFARKDMVKQEFGLLLEIDRNFSEKSEVSYRGQGPSYFSDGLLLVSYDKQERQKLIDTSFKKFKDVFGYYPKTVGAWWVGADSINYMQEKYGITAVLKASDQYKLDVYTIWGTPWNIPYLPSKVNEGIPAASFSESSKVVVLQWAARDPIKGYYDSTYSLQDFYLKGYDFSYVDYLFNIFLQKPYDNLVIGLENGGDLASFNKFYKSILKEAKNKQGIKVILAKDYARSYLETKKVFAGNSVNLAKSFDSNDQSLWVNSSNYRVLIEKQADKIYLSDLRIYSDRNKEDFYDFTNSQGNLWVGEKYLIDSKSFPESKKLILVSKENISLKKVGNILEAYSGNTRLAVFLQNSIKIFGSKQIIYSFNTKGLEEDIVLNRQHLLAFYLFPFGTLNTINAELNLLRLFPLILFPFLLFFSRNKKNLFFPIVLIYVSFYLTIPYFPLNKNNLIILFVSFSVIFVFIVLFGFFKFFKKRSYTIPIFLFVILATTGVLLFVSRTKEVVNTFEINALQFIRDQKRDVFFVSQQDYSVKPIYKAVRPLIYDDLNAAKKMSGVNWKVVLRPQNHILKIRNYKDKLIFIPRYLGSDLSDYEVKQLRLIKIYDNYQIAIYKSI